MITTLASYYLGQFSNNLCAEEEMDDRTLGYTPECFGNSRRTYKRDNIISLMFGNITYLPIHNNDATNDTLCQFISSHKFDITGLSELNKYWYKLSLEHRP